MNIPFFPLLQCSFKYEFLKSSRIVILKNGSCIFEVFKIVVNVNRVIIQMQGLKKNILKTNDLFRIIDSMAGLYLSSIFFSSLIFGPYQIFSVWIILVHLLKDNL